MPVDDEVYKYYLKDLGHLIRELAIEAKKQRDTTSQELDKTFDAGILMGFHRVVSLMQQQAQVFEIPFADLSLDGIDPERDLL